MIAPRSSSDDPFEDACQADCDVVVIGAGPAGCLAARWASQHGLRTLLIESKPFPRAKVCGGCLNNRALETFDRAGLGDLVRSCGATPLHAVELHSGRQMGRLQLPRGAVLTRATLDHALVNAAVQAGATFLPETSATVEPACNVARRRLCLRRSEERRSLNAKVVVCADGLARSSARLLPELAPHIASTARTGIGAVLEEPQLSLAAQRAYMSGCVVMAVARDGYVGVARAETGKAIAAAAVAPRFIKRAGTPASAINSILADAGLPVLDADGLASWQGTPLLTGRSRRVATTRLFVLGDAAGYVEPFTGEGMAWAAEGAEAVAPLVVEACSAWSPALADAWERCYRLRIRRRQLFCQGMSALLRRPWAVSLALGAVRSSPGLANRFVSWLHGPLRGRSFVALQS